MKARIQLFTVFAVLLPFTAYAAGSKKGPIDPRRGCGIEGPVYVADRGEREAAQWKFDDSEIAFITNPDDRSRIDGKFLDLIEGLPTDSTLSPDIAAGLFEQTKPFINKGCRANPDCISEMYRYLLDPRSKAPSDRSPNPKPLGAAPGVAYNEMLRGPDARVVQKRFFELAYNTHRRLAEKQSEELTDWVGFGGSPFPSPEAEVALRRAIEKKFASGSMPEAPKTRPTEEWKNLFKDLRDSMPSTTQPARSGRGAAIRESSDE
jgi:hypothetical protein